MGMLKEVPIGDDGKPFCMCIPPLFMTVGFGTVWQCDNCARIYLRVSANEHNGRAWVQITQAQWEAMR